MVPLPLPHPPPPLQVTGDRLRMDEGHPSPRGQTGASLVSQRVGGLQPQIL